MASRFAYLQVQPCKSSSSARQVLRSFDTDITDTQYALGAVANFVHRIVGGISPLEPGWKSSLIAPRPQPGSPIRSAKIAHLTPYGLLESSWSIHNDVLSVSGTVPLNTTAQVVIPGLPDRAIGSGRFTFSAPWEVSNDSWPPMPINGMFEQPPKDSFKDWNFTAV